jgi:hypothetical protein
LKDSVNDELPTDPVLDELIGIYGRAGRRLRILARTFAIRGQYTAAHAEGQLRLAETIIGRLERERRRRVPAIAAHTWAMGAGATDAVTGSPEIAFGGVHEDGVLRVAQALTEKLGDAELECGRRNRDLYRRIALRAVGEGQVEGATRKQISQAIIRDLTQEGVTSFVDKSGRRWALDTYARMVARTTSREAVTQATAARLLEVGRPDVTISDHDTTTPLCDRYEGNTYSLVRGGRYRFLAELPPFHPNCKHVLTPARTQFADFRAAMGRAQTWEELEATLVGKARAAA